MKVSITGLRRLAGGGRAGRCGRGRQALDEGHILRVWSGSSPLRDVGAQPAGVVEVIVVRHHVLDGLAGHDLGELGAMTASDRPR